MAKLNDDEVAWSIYFDKDNKPECNFINENVQEVIEELCERIGTEVTGITWDSTFVENSTLKNEWAKNTDKDLVSNRTPDVAMFKSRLIGAFYSNERSWTDTDIKLYTVPEGSGCYPLEKIWEWNIRDARTCRKTNFSPEVIVEKGDKIALFASDKGKDPKDVKIYLLWQVIETNSEENCENWSGCFCLTGPGASTTSKP